MTTRVSSPLLIGRARELDVLREALRAADEGVPTTVLIGGEAGIGKTRLLAEFTTEAVAAGAVVLEGACVSLGDDEGLPFAPIAEALRGLARRSDPETIAAVAGPAASELARLVPELGIAAGAAPLSGGRPEWVQTRVFEGLLGLLHRLGERAPVVLALEDLHWADRSTRDIVAFVARNARTERLLVVGTFRTDELHRRHPLRPWLAEMDRARHVRRVDLARLERDELSAQLEAILGAAPSRVLVDAVLRRSDGNPFFAEEIVAAGGDRAAALPDTLRDVLLARVGSLSDLAQDVLAVASVGGRVVDHALLTAAAARPDEELADGLREAVTAQLLVATVEGTTETYAFRHALLQEAVYDDLLPTDRRRVHAAYARALGARATPDGARGAVHLAALAHHASAAHELPRALDAWVAAARASMTTFAFAEAVRSFDRALGLWEAVDPADRPAGLDASGLLHEAAAARLLAGDLHGAHELAGRAVAGLDAAEDPLRSAVVRARLARTAWTMGNGDEAMTVLEEAARLVSGLPPTADGAGVVAALAGTLMLLGFPERAIAISEEAIAAARRAGARGPEAHALATLGVCLAQRGDCARGIDALRDALAITRAIGDPDDMGRAYANLASSLQICGDLESALAVSIEGAEVETSLGVGRTYGAFQQSNAASALVELGRWDEARERLAAVEAVEPEGVIGLGWAVQAGPLAAWSGDLATAHRVLDWATEAVGRIGDAQFTVPVFHGRVQLALVEGRIEDAEAIADEGIGLLANKEDPGLHAVLLGDAVRVAGELAARHRAMRDLDAAARAAARGRERLEQLRDTVATLPPTASMTREPRAVLLEAEAVASGLDGPDDPESWTAAAQAWDALGRPFRTAWARYREAEALVASGASRVEAERVARAAHATAAHLGARPLATSIEALARRARLRLEPDEAAAPSHEAAPGGTSDLPFPLTDREREVLGLLAQGYTNRRIAETLFISESTAGVHVSNILGKLGVAGRVEAAAVAVRLGLVG